MLFDKMAQIREIIGAICTIFNGHCPEEISPESFRQAKFDMNDTTPTLWRTLHTVLCINTFRPIDSSKHNLVNLCKHAMFQKGYKELLKYEERLEWFCNYAKALLLWVANEATFWKWMTSVLNAKMHDAKQTDRKADTSNCQEDQLLKPNRILQKTKEHQVELSQLLHLQETTYRTISKHWKKAKVVLQQSCVQNNDDLSKHLMLLDNELQLQMTELQEGSISECSKCWTQQTVPLCLRKLNQDQPRAGKASKEVSVVSQEIARLTKVKESLVYKLKTLQEKHKAKLYQVSHSHPNLICISSNMKGNGL